MVYVTKESKTQICETSGVVRFSSEQSARFSGYREFFTRRVELPPAGASPIVEEIGMEQFAYEESPAAGLLIEFSADCVVVLDFTGEALRLPLARPGPVGTVGRLELDGAPEGLTLENHSPTETLVATVAVWGGA